MQLHLSRICSTLLLKLLLKSTLENMEGYGMYVM